MSRNNCKRVAIGTKNHESLSNGVDLTSEEEQAFADNMDKLEVRACAHHNSFITLFLIGVRSRNNRRTNASTPRTFLTSASSLSIRRLRSPPSTTRLAAVAPLRFRSSSHAHVRQKLLGNFFYCCYVFFFKKKRNNNGMNLF